jgi:hypothetical protein
MYHKPNFLSIFDGRLSVCFKFGGFTDGVGEAEGGRDDEGGEDKAGCLAGVTLGCGWGVTPTTFGADWVGG